MPSRKPGLWEVTLVANTGGMPERKMQQCTDEAMDKKLMQMGNDMGGAMGIKCSKNEVKQVGDHYITESICKMGTTEVSSKADFSGDFKAQYQGEIDSKFNPPLMGTAASNTKISGRWLGPCAADQKSGDVIMQGGMKINFNDLAANMPKQGTPPPQ